MMDMREKVKKLTEENMPEVETSSPPLSGAEF